MREELDKVKTAGRQAVLRLGLPASVVALALVGAYLYGTTHSSAVVALPQAITIAQPTAVPTPTAPTAVVSTEERLISTTMASTVRTMPQSLGADSTATSARTETPPTTSIAPPTTAPPTVTSVSGGSTGSGVPRPDGAPVGSVPANRDVVRPIWGWDCDPDDGSRRGMGSTNDWGGGY